MLTLPVQLDSASLLYIQIREYWPEAVAVTEHGPWSYPAVPRGKRYLQVFRDKDAYLSSLYLRWVCPHMVTLDLVTGEVTGNPEVMQYLTSQPIWL